MADNDGQVKEKTISQRVMKLVLANAMAELNRTAQGAAEGSEEEGKGVSVAEAAAAAGGGGAERGPLPPLPASCNVSSLGSGPKNLLPLLNSCACEFVRLLTSEANDVCAKENRVLVNLSHLTKALQNLGFDEFIEAAKDAGTPDEKEKEGRKMKREKKKRRKLTAAEEADLAAEQDALLAGAHRT